MSVREATASDIPEIHRVRLTEATGWRFRELDVNGEAIYDLAVT